LAGRCLLNFAQPAFNSGSTCFRIALGATLDDAMGSEERYPGVAMKPGATNPKRQTQIKPKIQIRTLPVTPFALALCMACDTMPVLANGQRDGKVVLTPITLLACFVPGMRYNTGFKKSRVAVGDCLRYLFRWFMPFVERYRQECSYKSRGERPSEPGGRRFAWTASPDAG